MFARDIIRSHRRRSHYWHALTRGHSLRIQVEYNKLDDRREYNFRNSLNSRRVSAGQALVNLYRVVSQINPEPEEYKSSEERFRKLTSLEMMKSAFFESWIQDAAYGVISQYANYKPAKLPDAKVDEIFDKRRYEARRLYEAVRQEIDIRLLYQQVLNRYKTRCTLYDFDEVRRLVSDEKGKPSSKREHLLTLHLARYLYDNGIPVIYRPKAGQQEWDVLGIEPKEPLLIEVKVYKDNAARNEIVSGIAQLHAYLNNLSAIKNVREAYYVVYRLGGPLYELPEEIVTNRFTIGTVLIDVGRAFESGSKQPRPIVIPRQEIIGEIEKAEKKVGAGVRKPASRRALARASR